MKRIYKKLHYVLVLALIFSSGNLSSQDIQPLSYYQQELYINPAFAGSQGLFSSSLGLSAKWVGFKGANNMQMLQAHMPFNNEKVGVGITFMNDSYGAVNQLRFNGAYSYRIKFDKNILSLGLQAGLATYSQGDISVDNVNDPMFMNTGTLMGFNFGIGAYYTSDKYYIGFSIPRFMDNTIKEGEANKLNNSILFEKIPFYLTAGYVFNISEGFDLKPSVLLNYSNHTNLRYDAGATAFLSNRFWIGAFLRSRNEIGGVAGFNLFKYLNVSYSYNTNYSDPYVNLGATHQIILGFNWSKDVSKLKLRYF